MEFEKDVNYLGIEEKKISKGERAGQSFFILKFICLNDTYEIMLFDNPILVGKFANLQRFQEVILRLKVTQNNGNVKLSVLDLVA